MEQTGTFIIEASKKHVQISAHTVCYSEINLTCSLHIGWIVKVLESCTKHAFVTIFCLIISRTNIAVTHCIKNGCVSLKFLSVWKAKEVKIWLLFPAVRCFTPDQCVGILPKK